jgi:hypothetical protein
MSAIAGGTYQLHTKDIDPLCAAGVAGHALDYLLSTPLRLPTSIRRRISATTILFTTTHATAGFGHRDDHH